MAANNQAVVGKLNISASRMKEFWSQVEAGALTDTHIDALIEHRDPFASPPVLDDHIRDRLAWWREHYRNFYGMNPDFSNLIIPPHQEGFDRLVIMAKGWKMKQWVEAANRIHGVYLYQENPDLAIPTHSRSCTNRSYAIWIRDRQEADEELKNLSANDLAKQEIVCIDAPERLVAGSAYLLEKGRHMDEDNITLCAGSRCSDGDVPSVNWDSADRRVRVFWCTAAYAHDRLRARAVVSLPQNLNLVPCAPRASTLVVEALLLWQQQGLSLPRTASQVLRLELLDTKPRTRNGAGFLYLDTLKYPQG